MKPLRLTPAALIAAALFLSLAAHGPVHAEEEGGEPQTPAASTRADGAKAASGAAAADPRYVWDLSTIFRDDAAWEAERQALLAEARKLAALREGFGRDAARLARRGARSAAPPPG